jgi:hypothetical protein
MNRIALVVEGEAVWPMFRVEVHVSREVLKPVERHEVVVGLDFGRSPAAVFMQAVNNRVLRAARVDRRERGRGRFRAEGEAVPDRALSGLFVPLLRGSEGRGQGADRRSHGL